MARPVASPVAAYQTPVARSVELQNVFEYRRNWGRWGPDDQMGAVNLITPARRTAAAALVKSGRTVSLSRGFEPSQHFIRITERPEFSTASDYYGSLYHGPGVTHVDALSHMWDRHGMWNGRDAAREIDTNGRTVRGHRGLRRRADRARRFARRPTISSNSVRDQWAAGRRRGTRRRCACPGRSD